MLLFNEWYVQGLCCRLMSLIQDGSLLHCACHLSWNIGVTRAFLQLDGIWSWSSDAWSISWRTGESSTATSFRKQAGTLSGPVALWRFSFFRSFSTSVVWTCICIMSSYRPAPRSGIVVISLWVNTDENWSLRIPALILLSAWMVLLLLRPVTAQRLHVAPEPLHTFACATKLKVQISTYDVPHIIPIGFQTLALDLLFQLESGHTFVLVILRLL